MDSEIKSDRVVTPSTDLEMNIEACPEEIECCSPSTPSTPLTPSTPSTNRRRNKRIPISSAIPLLPAVEQKQGPPVKPEPGKKGTVTHVYTNHFPTQIAPNIMLYQYDAIVEKPGVFDKTLWEEVMSRDQRRRFVQQLVENNKFDFIFW